MPATAGRVRMPANNRVHSSAALQTHGIWQVAIGYDPYAPANKEPKPDSAAAGNAYDSFQGLLSLARLTSAGGSETRGACKKCGRVGHLTYQCRNFLSLKDDGPPENDDSALRTASAVFERMKRAAGGGREEKESESEEEEEDDDEISSSDSDVDPEIERIIAERFGKPLSKKAATLSKKPSNSSSGDGSDSDTRKKRKHGHKKRRRSHGRSRHRHRGDSSDDGSDSDRHRRHKRGRMRRRRSESSDYDSGMRHKERSSVLSSGSESTASSSDEDERREKRRSKGHRRRWKD